MLKSKEVEEFAKAICDQSPVTGLTHNFYRYPARFSPTFANVAIRLFTNPGDLVIDPFVGGGTTLVESSVLGRKAIGIDINSLGIFLSKVKTTPISIDDAIEIRSWSDTVIGNLNLHRPAIRAREWAINGYQNNINGKQTWPIRKTIELVLYELTTLSTEIQKNFVRCVLLRTSQWAVDCRKHIPSASEIREKFKLFLEEMLDGMVDYSNIYNSNKTYIDDEYYRFPMCLYRPISGIENVEYLDKLQKPKLVLTSPPYPGIHILYHRWQVHGGKEVSAPYWIADCIDGRGASYYTFGDRQTHDSGQYYDRLRSSFSSIFNLCSRDTVIIQMIGFANPKVQLQKYLSVLSQVGFQEMKTSNLSNSSDGRIWRSVPNRKWYNERSSIKGQRSEVVLFHKLAH